MATFGEMTALATDHLTDLQHQLHTKRLARDLARRAVQPELARLAHVLARYHDQIANGFGDPHPHTTGLRDAANRASALIKQAEQILGTPADTEAPRSALAEKLRATSIALGCGLDLLSTHFPVNSGNDKPTATGAIITAPDTARSLLHQLSTHTATVAHLTQRTPSPANDASGLLLRAAVLSRIHSETEPRRAIIAVPFHGIPQRRPTRSWRRPHANLRRDQRQHPTPEQPPDHHFGHHMALPRQSRNHRLRPQPQNPPATHLPHEGTRRTRPPISLPESSHSNKTSRH